jgi:predicted transposase/invertase (TIGR01784 family)
MSKIWEKDGKNKEEKKVIIPILFYHSDKEWNFKTNFNEHIKNHNSDLDCFVPKFNIYYFNLNKIERIIGKAELQLLLMILKYKNNPDVINTIEKRIFFGMINDYFIILVANFLNYTTKNEDYDNFLYKINNTKIGGNMVSIAEYMKKEGEQIGIQKGREEGEFRKQIEMAKRMLQKRCTLNFISEITGLSVERIKRLQ